MPLVTVESSGTGTEASSSLDHAPFTMMTFFGTFLTSCVDAETPACVPAALPSNGSNTDNATSAKHRAIPNRTNYLLNSGCSGGEAPRVPRRSPRIRVLQRSQEIENLLLLEVLEIVKVIDDRVSL